MRVRIPVGHALEWMASNIMGALDDITQVFGFDSEWELSSSSRKEVFDRDEHVIGRGWGKKPNGGYLMIEAVMMDGDVFIDIYPIPLDKLCRIEFEHVIRPEVCRDVV